MKKLIVRIEIGGESKYVGEIAEEVNAISRQILKRGGIRNI